MIVCLIQENLHFMINTFNNNKDLILDTSKDDLIISNTFNLDNNR